MIRVFALAITLTLTGCIFLMDVPGGDLDRCTFAGSTLRCGACLAQQCTDEVNACCNDKTCLSAMSAVETCARAGDCEPLSGGLSQQQVIYQCAGRACASECGFTGTQNDAGTTRDSGTKTKTFCTVSGSSCSCEATVPTNNTACGANLSSARCCADTDWPDVGSQCSCRQYRCDSTSNGCECDEYAVGTVSTCSGAVCCAREGSCTCYYSRTTCPVSGDTIVSSCQASAVRCAQNRKGVTACAP